MPRCAVMRHEKNRGVARDTGATAWPPVRAVNHVLVRWHPAVASRQSRRMEGHSPALVILTGAGRGLSTEAPGPTRLGVIG